MRYGRRMHRNRYVGYLAETERGFLACFDLHWNVVDTRRIDPGIGAGEALAAYIDEFIEWDWIPEANPEYGFVFIGRDGVRLLLMATPKDPDDKRVQTFSPFQNKKPEQPKPEHDEF